MIIIRNLYFVLFILTIVSQAFTQSVNTAYRALLKIEVITELDVSIEKFEAAIVDASLEMKIFAEFSHDGNLAAQMQKCLEMYQMSYKIWKKKLVEVKEETPEYLFLYSNYLTMEEFQKYALKCFQLRGNNKDNFYNEKDNYFSKRSRDSAIMIIWQEAGTMLKKTSAIMKKTSHHID